MDLTTSLVALSPVLLARLLGLMVSGVVSVLLVGPGGGGEEGMVQNTEPTGVEPTGVELLEEARPSRVGVLAGARLPSCWRCGLPEGG